MPPLQETEMRFGIPVALGQQHACERVAGQVLPDRCGPVTQAIVLPGAAPPKTATSEPARLLGIRTRVSGVITLNRSAPSLVKSGTQRNCWKRKRRDHFCELALIFRGRAGEQLRKRPREQRMPGVGQVQTVHGCARGGDHPREVALGNQRHAMSPG